MMLPPYSSGVPLAVCIRNKHFVFSKVSTIPLIFRSDFETIDALPRFHPKIEQKTCGTGVWGTRAG